MILHILQFCLKLALLAALPECYGGLNGRVVYIDTESKFSSWRLLMSLIIVHFFDLYLTFLCVIDMF
jgi:hypothetical protein